MHQHQASKANHSSSSMCSVSVDRTITPPTALVKPATNRKEADEKRTKILVRSKLPSLSRPVRRRVLHPYLCPMVPVRNTPHFGVRASHGLQHISPKVLPSGKGNVCWRLAPYTAKRTQELHGGGGCVRIQR